MTPAASRAPTDTAPHSRKRWTEPTLPSSSAGAAVWRSVSAVGVNAPSPTQWAMLPATSPAAPTSAPRTGMDRMPATDTAAAPTSVRGAPYLFTSRAEARFPIG
nr:hypothetical protein [Thermoactinospora rubra]